MVAVAAAGTRSFYITEFADECVPCDCTIEGWAEWLASPVEHDEDGCAEWGRAAVPEEGTVFAASAILWHPDIVAARENGVWSLSSDPGDDDFLAVRFCAGAGWSSDNIIYQSVDFAVLDAGGQSMRDALLAWLSEFDEACDEIEHVACGISEECWALTFHAGPPDRLTAERTN